MAVKLYFHWNFYLLAKILHFFSIIYGFLHLQFNLKEQKVSIKVAPQVVRIFQVGLKILMLFALLKWIGACFLMFLVYVFVYKQTPSYIDQDIVHSLIMGTLRAYAVAKCMMLLNDKKFKVAGKEIVENLMRILKAIEENVMRKPLQYPICHAINVKIFVNIYFIAVQIASGISDSSTWLYFGLMEFFYFGLITYHLTLLTIHWNFNIFLLKYINNPQKKLTDSSRIRHYTRITKLFRIMYRIYDVQRLMAPWISPIISIFIVETIFFIEPFTMVLNCILSPVESPFIRFWLVLRVFLSEVFYRWFYVFSIGLINFQLKQEQAQTKNLLSLAESRFRLTYAMRYKLSCLTFRIQCNRFMAWLNLLSLETFWFDVIRLDNEFVLQLTFSIILISISTVQYHLAQIKGYTCNDNPLSLRPEDPALKFKVSLKDFFG